MRTQKRYASALGACLPARRGARRGCAPAGAGARFQRGHPLPPPAQPRRGRPRPPLHRLRRAGRRCGRAAPSTAPAARLRGGESARCVASACDENGGCETWLALGEARLLPGGGLAPSRAAAARPPPAARAARPARAPPPCTPPQRHEARCAVAPPRVSARACAHASARSCRCTAGSRGDIRVLHAEAWHSSLAVSPLGRHAPF